MAEKRTPLPKHRSPKGIAKYAWLNEPDTKFDTPGVYKVSLIVADEDDAATLRATIEAAQKEAKKEAVEKAKEKKGKKPTAYDLPIEDDVDEEGDETGATVFKFKAKSGGERKDGKSWSRKLPLYDAKGKPTSVKVYSGSTIRVSFVAMPWVNPKLEYGVKLGMEAVQIIDLITGGGNQSADSYGFEDEDGWEDDSEEDDFKGSAGEADDDDEDDEEDF